MEIMHTRSYFKVRPFKDLREMLRQSTKLYGNLPAFRFRDTPTSEIIRRSYRELEADINALGTALMGLGLHGKKIAIIGENSYRWALAHLSVINGIGVAVPLDRLLPEGEIVALLKRAQVSAIFFDKSFLPVMKLIAEEVPSITHFISLKAAPQKKIENQPEVEAFKKAFHVFEDILAQGRQALALGDKTYLDLPIDPEAIISLLFTSGTTSTAKGVMLRNRNITADIIALAKVEKFPVGSRLLSVLPLHHTFENTCGLLYPLYMGGCICISDGLRYIQQNMTEYKINMIIGVPALFESFYKKIMDNLKKQEKLKTVQKLIRLTNTLLKVKIDLRRLFYRRIIKAFGGHFRFGICGAAPIDPEIIVFFENIGIRILQGYGLTETSPVVAGCNYKVFIPGTVGMPLGDITLAVDNLSKGAEGEILVKGDVVMAGYYEDPEATTAAIDQDGWFHTGDVGTIDPANGCLRITGRLKSMIVLKSGKKVFPEEIEQLISRYSFIKESLIFGDSQPDGEVTISAKFVLDPATLNKEGISEEELAHRLASVVKEINLEMPGFKGIRNYVYSFQELIKTTTQKVKRPSEIRQMQERLDRGKVKLRQLTGKNIDLLDSTLPVKPLEDLSGVEQDVNSAAEKASPSQAEPPK